MTMTDEATLREIGRLESEISRLRNRIEAEDEESPFTGMCEECRKAKRYCFLDADWKRRVPNIPDVPKVDGKLKVRV